MLELASSYLDTIFGVVRRSSLKSGVSASAINKIEQGAWLPSLKTIRKMAPILGVDPVEVDEFKAAIEK